MTSLTVDIPEDLHQLTLKDLEALIYKINAFEEDLLRVKISINVEMGRKQAVESAQKKFATLSAAERDAIVHLVGVQGIQSAEKVGRPGS